MKSSRPRVRVLAAVFLAGSGLVLLRLVSLAVEQHELWRVRSFANRWAFRDVPARRGSILARGGEVLAEDRPCFSLFLHYRSFRRRHPVGIAVHAANLLMRARGIGDDYFAFTRAGRGPRAAFAAFVQSEAASWMAAAPETARDLRFYARALARAMLWGEARRRAWQALREPPRHEPLYALLGFSNAPAALAAFDARWEELGKLDREVQDSKSALGDGLWQALEQARRRRRREPRSEFTLQRVRDSVPFALAARIGIARERLPGLELRPSVTRVRHPLPGRRDLMSLEPILGVVTPFWREDRPRIEQLVAERLGCADIVTALAKGAGEPDAGLREEAEEELRRTLRSSYATRGRVGRGGVEEAFDEILSGAPGLRWVERSRGAREKGLWSQLDVMPGRDVRLTVDLELQEAVEDVLDGALRESGGREAAMAFLDPVSGDVLALGGRPLRTPGGRRRWTTPAAMWSGVGYLGSVAKPFVLLEQLDAARRGRPCGDPASFRACVGRFGVVRGSSRSLTCSGSHGEVARDPVASLAKSCNFFFFQAAEGLGAEGIRRAYERAGWVRGADSERYQVAIAGIGALGRAGLDSSGHVLESQAIGYGLQASALHVARAYAGLATGRLPTLGLARPIDVAAPRARIPLGVMEADLEVVREGLRGCVLPGGTAGGLRGLRSLGVLGKTGTAEVSRAGHNNAWFAGYLTRARPTLAFAAVVYMTPHGRHGGEVAGRLVAEVLERVSRRDRLRARYLPEASGR